MYKIVKRSGAVEECVFEKIHTRMKDACDYVKTDKVNATMLAQKVIQGLKDNITSQELDDLAAMIAASHTADHPDYSKVAAYITVTSLHKATPSSFDVAMDKLQADGKFDSELYKKLSENDEYVKYTALIDDSRDFNFDYFGIKTLEKSYLLKVGGKVIERPQYMYLRVALGIHGLDYEKVKTTYDLLSQGYFTHATPTLFNAGTPRPQLSSCFLTGIHEDSLADMYDTLKDVAMISKYSGGIGIHIHDIRANGSYIRGTGGTSHGIVPMLRVYNDTARHVDQSGKRKGAFAVYLEPWHSEIFDFLDLRKNNGKEEMRTRDLFTALWIPDLFMRRVESDGVWSLMCPDTSRGLSDVYGEEFDKLYESYEAQGLYKKQVKARDVWAAIIQSQIETGTPYMLYKDAANSKSNQKNLGTIKNSNLCSEIIEYTAPDEIAVCNLASIALPSYVVDDKFDFDKLHEVVEVVTENLDKVIDVNYYPVATAENSNKRHRPIGIGVQGLADVFFKLGLPFDSQEAKELNADIFETIYHAAVTASVNRAKEFGSYESFKGSPASQGLLQFDLWGVTPRRYNFTDLKEAIKEHGLRNSLLLAPMPTASTAQVLGNTECFEPITSNLYTRAVLSGEFTVINRYLVTELEKLGLWGPDMKSDLILNDGSIQDNPNLPLKVIPNIPKYIKDVYKTVWELSQKTIIDMSADRGAYVCQSQSLNLFVADPNMAKLSSMHFYAWKKGLKTGMYYLRSKASTSAKKITVEVQSEQIACSLDNPEACESCSG